MTLNIDQDIIANEEVRLEEDSNGNLVLEHKTTGATLTYDSANGAWVPADGVRLPDNLVNDATGETVYDQEAEAIKSDIDNEAVSTDELRNIADQIIGPSDSIQGAFDAASNGDTIYLGSGRYQPDTTPTTGKRLSLVGESLTVISDEPHPDSRPAALEGTVIEPQTGGEHGLKLSASGEQVNLYNIGVTWPDALKDSDTGHGIYCDPPSDGAGYQKDGIFNGEFQNVAVVGTDGDHYGLVTTNAQHLYGQKWKFWGGGGYHDRTNHNETNLGNHTIVDLYSRLDVSGSAAGIMHTAINYKNTLSCYIRPQVNISGAISAGETKNHIEASESEGGDVLRKGYYHTDLEEVNDTAGDNDLGRDAEITFAIREPSITFARSPITFTEDVESNHRINAVETRNTEIHGTRAVRFDETGSTPPPVSGGVKLFARGDNSAQFVHEDGSLSVKIYREQSFEAIEQDLSALSLGAAQTGRIYRHDGSNSISADGGTTSSAGYYAWDNSTNEFKSIVQF